MVGNPLSLFPSFICHAHLLAQAGALFLEVGHAPLGRVGCHLQFGDGLLQGGALRVPFRLCRRCVAPLRLKELGAAVGSNKEGKNKLHTSGDHRGDQPHGVEALAAPLTACCCP